MNAPDPSGDVLITGGTGAIGMAIVRRLSAEGYRLHIAARDETRCTALQQAIGAQTPLPIYRLDLRDTQQAELTVQNFLSAASRPTGLVLAAGELGSAGPFVDTEFDAWFAGFKSNFVSHAAMIRLFARGLRQNGAKRGTIVVFSGAGLGGNSDFSHVTSYSTAKAAISHLAEGLALELAQLGITINAVAPGAVLSRMTDQAITAGEAAPGYAAAARHVKTSGGVSADLAAELVAFLFSEAGRAVTGRLLSARFDLEKLKKGPRQVGADVALYRLRRIDNDLFGPVKK